MTEKPSREVQVRDLAQYIGCDISFRRPGTVDYGRPVIHGGLLNITRQDYLRGNMRREGYALELHFPGVIGNVETYGPIPAHVVVKVLGPARSDVPLYDRDPFAHQEFMPHVVRVVVTYKGGPYDGEVEERKPSDFGRMSIIRHHPTDPDVRLRYRPGGFIRSNGDQAHGVWHLSNTFNDREIRERATREPRHANGSSGRDSDVLT